VQDIGPLTLRQLAWRAKAKIAHDWAQTAAITSWIYQMNAGSNSPKLPAEVFNPMLREENQ